MGVPGLTNYLNQTSGVFQEYKLRDTKVVIDGFGCASYILKHSKANIWFGGDYDVFYEILKDFFEKLKMCNVESIVVLDGGKPEKKLGHKVENYLQNLSLLKDIHRKKVQDVPLPLLLGHTLIDVLTDLKIKYIRCWMEADQEIASLASFLNCPVLGFDSDYFIFGCLYIPLDKLFPPQVKLDSSKKPPEWYLDCQLHDVNELVSQFGGDKRLLRIMSALLGNDYVDVAIFHKFYKHLSIDTIRVKSLFKVDVIFKWLKNKTFDSAKSTIIQNVEEKDVERALEVINLTCESYELLSPPMILYNIEIESSGISKESENFITAKRVSKLPDEMVERYLKNRLPSIVIEIVHLKKVFLPLQIEDVTKESCHCISLPILSGISYLVSNFVGIKQKLTAVLKMYGSLSKIEIPCNPDSFSGFDAKTLMSAPVNVRISFMYKVLSLDESDISRVELFNEDWRMLVVCVLYWFKNSNAQSSNCHFHSIILMILANLAQSYVTNVSSPAKRKAGELDELSEEAATRKDAVNSFADILNAVTKLEYVKVTEKFMKLRKKYAGTKKPVYHSCAPQRATWDFTLHVFAMFQSVLHHVLKLNEILDSPMSPLRVNKIYSGTLVYNIYCILEKEKNFTEFVHGFFETEPNVSKVFDFFVDTLQRIRP